jgi:type III secretory pathway component EscU
MLSFQVNWVAFIVALVAAQVLGFLWYSTTMFGKAWMKAIGKTEKQLRAQSQPTDYAYTVVGAAIMILVLVNVLMWAGVAEVSGAMVVAFILWLGFVATGSAMNTVFEGRAWNLFWINSGYHLANMVIAAAILTLL